MVPIAYKSPGIREVSSVNLEWTFPSSPGFHQLLIDVIGVFVESVNRQLRGKATVRRGVVNGRLAATPPPSSGL